MNAKGIGNHDSNIFKTTHTEDGNFRAFFMLAFTMNRRDSMTQILLEIPSEYGCFTYLFKFSSKRQDLDFPTENIF